ncbi:hypothetical protein D9758_013746 [Tetrapyrgos nigripes]|uniref:Uncharacterized protein n=1 Tax=Tetrapyrgos nigripes TaxID=182062 RepID=A0A8H5LGX2_9AGAR|nr:hypothetical protein D9758_013746 [Tetrapyrgos nigripes]
MPPKMTGKCEHCNEPLDTDNPRSVETHYRYCDGHKESLKNIASSGIRKVVRKNFKKVTSTSTSSTSPRVIEDSSKSQPMDPINNDPGAANLFPDPDPESIAISNKLGSNPEELLPRPCRTVRIPVPQPDPEAVVDLEVASAASNTPAPLPSLPSASFAPTQHTTELDQFHVFRIYQTLPGRYPNISESDRLGDAPTFSVADEANQYLANAHLKLAQEEDSGEEEENGTDWFAPFENPSAFRLSNWYTEANGNLSLAHVDHLVANVLKKKDFDVADLDNFHAAKEIGRLDQPKNGDTNSIFSSHVWSESSVNIHLPHAGSIGGEENAPTLEIKGIHRRSFVEVIRTAFIDVGFLKFSLSGFQEFWRPTPDSSPDRLYSEVFTADEYLETEHELFKQQQDHLSSLSDSGSDSEQGAPSSSSGSGQGAPSSPSDSKSGSESVSSNSKSGSEFTSSNSESGSESTSSNSTSGSESVSSSSDNEPSYPSYKHPKPTPPHNNPSSPIPWLMVPIMIYSDATRVNTFGNTSLWPVYVYFLGLSKYSRPKPSSGAAHHFAYIPSLPNIQEMYQKHFKATASSEVLTHLKRELMQAIWFLLLDTEFVKACIHGILVLCADNIWRRLFPRIFIYSADYPEKMLLACLKTLGRCPCPRCEIEKKDISQMGTFRDMNRRHSKARTDSHPLRWNVQEARRRIFEKGKAVGSRSVQVLLEPLSQVPTNNAFSAFFQKLLNTSQNYFDLFAVDLMHEFELGVFKALFEHLVRIAYSLGDEVIADINKQFKKCPPFGRCTIRRFTDDTTSMKRIAARDYEDILQCCPSVFCQLFPPEIDHHTQDLLFAMATWHALAKLRLHSETTLKILEGATHELGIQLRTFKKQVCDSMQTVETPKERTKRERREALEAEWKKQVAEGIQQGEKELRCEDVPEKKSKGKKKHMEDKGVEKAKKAKGKRKRDEKDSRSGNEGKAKKKEKNKGVEKAKKAKGKRKRDEKDSGSADEGKAKKKEKKRHRKIQKNFNLFTYKIHALADYAPTICRKGTTDNYSTQIGEQEHRLVKIFYVRTNRRNFVFQISKQNAHKHCSEAIAQREFRWIKKKTPLMKETDSDPLPLTNPNKPYHISESQRYPITIDQFMQNHHNDEAVQGFGLRLHNFILTSLGHPEDPLTFTPVDRNLIIIQDNKMYEHKILRTNFITYDRRQDQDFINPHTRSDVMVLAKQDEQEQHPYWYCRVLGIFHVNVLSKRDPIGTPAKLIEFLWVRWYTLDTSYAPKNRLPRLSFIDSADPNAFGFIHPKNVIRAVHLIPHFARKTTKSLLSVSIAQRNDEADKDWRYYDINIFADRDIFMRYTGLGVGHIGTYKATGAFRDEVVRKYVKAMADMEDEDMDTPQESQADEAEMAVASDEEGILGVQGIIGVEEEVTSDEEGDEEEGDENEEGANDEVEHIGYSVL